MPCRTGPTCASSTRIRWCWFPGTSGSARASVAAEQGVGLLLLDDAPVGVQQAEAADGVEPELPAEDLAGLGLRAAAHGRPARPGQPGFLHLEFGVHGCPPSARNGPASGRR